jgi:anaerobic ribonucleoside-triphosphate reductase activating protein
MLKYVNTEIVFAEIPGEISLAINISKCPCHCKGCHSPYLAEDIGTYLDENSLFKLLIHNCGISCVLFMGGDLEPSSVNSLAILVKQFNKELKVGWYSGRNALDTQINPDNFDYIKLGEYKEVYGPLNNKRTNQRLFKKDNNEECIYFGYGLLVNGWSDITKQLQHDKC